MMTYQQFLLMKLAEECNEVAHMALKTMQYGMDERNPDLVKNNRERLHDEINDLMAIIAMLNDEVGLDYEPNEKAVAAKHKKVYNYYTYSVSLGLVSDERLPVNQPYTFKPNT